MPKPPARKGPTRCTNLPPYGAMKTIGRTKSVTPVFAIHVGAPRSFIISAHSESNVPIMKKSAIPMSTPAATARSRSRSMANRSVGWSSAGTSGIGIEKMMRVTNVSTTPMATKGAGMPNGSTRNVETTGPAAKPPTSHESTRPRLRPRCSLSLTMMTRRIAGRAHPKPRPDMNREPSNCGSVSENAIAKLPMMARVRPTKISCRERPRSASGAMVSWAKNEVKNPMAMTRPSEPSLIPNCSR